jgi:hypothetical protein
MEEKDQFKTAENYRRIIEAKALIVHQLTSSKDISMKYKLRVDFLNNHTSENYVQMIQNRTKKSKEELYELATTFVKDINGWIYTELSHMKEEKLAELMNEPYCLDKFLKKLKKVIGEDKDDIFLQKCC